VLGLEDAEDALLRTDPQFMGPRAPPGVVDAVVGLAEADVECGGERRPPEPAGFGELLPARDLEVALVEDDERLGDSGDVTDERLCLGAGESMTESPRVSWRLVQLEPAVAGAGVAT
jgi:hypothetical protein